MVAIAIPADKNAPRFSVGRSAADPSAQMTNHDSALEQVQPFRYDAPHIFFLFGLLVILAGRVIIWSR